MSEAQTRLPWTAEEDAILIDLVQKYGEKRWNMVANGLPGRTGKGCSHRWRTYLRPDVKHPHLEPFTEWEAAVIVQAQRDMGNNWLAIAKLLLPGRSNTAVKNFWHCRLKSGSGTHTNRFIVENYNLRYLLNEVEEKDRLHPVALPAFPSTAPTGHVRRQIHPRPRQEAAAQAAAAAEAALLAQQVAAHAQAMGMDPQTYMQQAGMMEGYGMYGTYEQMAMSQQAAYGPMPPPSFSSKDELKQHASSYVQQQLALMGHPPTSRHASGGGSSRLDSAAGLGAAYSSAGWQGGYDGTAAAAAGGAAAAGTKKPGRGRGRPPGSKNQNAQSKADASAGGADADAAAVATAEQLQLYQQQQAQQQYSMNPRVSQDEAATWCSSGMMLAGSAAAGAAAAGGPQGSPGGEVHSSTNFAVPQYMPASSSAPAGAAAAGDLAAPAGDPLDPAALAAAPLPLAASTVEAAAAGMPGGDAHTAAGVVRVSPGPECCGLLPTSAAAAAELNKLDQFRVSMTGLDLELEAAGGGGSTVRFSTHTLRLIEGEEAASCLPATYKTSLSSMDFRHSLTSLEEVFGATHSGANRMSDHTHVGLRGTSWDGTGTSPRSQPDEDAAAAAAAGPVPAAAARAPAAEAAAAGPPSHAQCSSEADAALAAAFKQQQPAGQQQLGLPPSSSAGMAQGATAWVAAVVPPKSAAADHAAAYAGHGAVGSLKGVASGSFTFVRAPPCQEEIHPGAIAAIKAEAPAATSELGPGADAPFGAEPLQSAPFSPGAHAAAAGAAGAMGAPGAAFAGMQQALPAQQQQHMVAATDAGMGASSAPPASSQPPTAPRMPPAFHSVLQALQPPVSMAPTSSSSAALYAASAGMTVVKSEPQHQHQHMGHECALAAASPAITGLSAAPGTMTSTSFLLPAAAAGGGLQHQQQLAMPLPLPSQLLLLPPQHQQVPGGRVSEYGMGPLPSPIELFNGDHGLRGAEDLLIGTEDVFDERMLACSMQAQHQHLQHHPGMHVQHYGQHHGPASTAQPCAAGQFRAAAPPSLHDAGLLAGHDDAGVLQEHPDASARQGTKRRRSSNNGSGWTKKQRPSDGSLVEVRQGASHHGMDDCVHFWHD